MFVLCASVAATQRSVAAQQPAPLSSAVPAASHATSPALPVPYDAFTNVLSEPQRKMIDRDSRCRDARSATDAFVASSGTELQTGVDAMAALEKCATLQRVGGDWRDFCDYVITAAAAIAYEVGVTANDDRLLHRAIDDASHVNGYDASSVTVFAYSRSDTAPDSNVGHRMGEGPPQASEQYTRDVKRVSPDAGAFGALATKIGAAAAARLQALAATH